MKLKFPKFDVVSEGGDGSSAVPTIVNTKPDETQTANANVAISPNADIPKELDNPSAWVGDNRYFQSGKKQGQLKPSASAEKVGGLDAEKQRAKGLNIDALKSTAPQKAGTIAQDKNEKPKPTKQEKKEGEARVAAKLYMRTLDTIVQFISGGTYGKDFTSDQKDKRNAYAEELEENAREYFLTLDIPMHPGLVLAFSSIMFVAPAFDTEKGQKKAASIKAKFLGGLLSRIF